MSLFTKELKTVSDVDSAISREDKKLVVIRFGDSRHPLCLYFDELLSRVSELVSNFVIIYSCENENVPQLRESFDLYDHVNIMCFYKSKHIKIDCSTGNNNKINFLIKTKEELVDLFTLAYKGGYKGKGLVVSPIKYSKARKK
jgi:DIM1 family U5 snRNP protein